jgi:hypothetical protein
MLKGLANFANLSRFAPASHLRAVAAESTPLPKYLALGAYSPSNLLAWLGHVSAYMLHPKHKFLSYPPDAGTLLIDNQAAISIAADWASGTNEAASVAKQISAFVPDYTIHLGDTYYVGSGSEVNENFLGIKASGYDPVTWPRGKKGTFALPGNHDMYTDGYAFFDVLLPAIGQGASFFRLSNDHWNIVGLDTAYNSTGLEFWPFKPSCKLRDEQMKWLASLNLKGDSRGLIILSHHQPWSAFETAYPAAFKQLAPFLPAKVCFWFWGHEHRMAIYETQNGIAGRCIGHGGMPIKIKKPKDSPVCTFTDSRLYPNSENLTVGYNGFVNLTLNGPLINVDYRDLKGALQYHEELMAK